MTDDAILEAAAMWYVRQDADDMDWLAFEAWLVADPRHRETFDDVAMLDRDIDDRRNQLQEDDCRNQLQELVQDNAPTAKTGRAWRPWLLVSGAVAAAVLVVLLDRQPDVTAPPAPGAPRIYQASATPRDIQLASARITLAPGSEIRVRTDDHFRVALAGRAIFSVRHDPSRTLVVRAQGYDIRDVGTRFEIVAGAGRVRVKVAEGELAIRAIGGGNREVRVSAGHMATGLTDGRITTSSADPAALDGWRTGPLVYDAMPLGLVVADIARTTGQPIRADDAIAQRPFSGVLAKGDGPTMIGTLATIAGLEARRQGETIYLGDRAQR